MSSALPTDTADRMVNDFGVGTYDSMSSAETSEADYSLPPSVPTDTEEPDSYEPYLSHPGKKSRSVFSALLAANPELSRAVLPGDSSHPPPGKNPSSTILDSLALSPTNSGRGPSLPSDSNNPTARSDYYDTMQIGAPIEDMFPSGDTGAYVSSDSLPVAESNDMETSNNLGAFGNSESGYIVEDQSDPRGFPSTDLVESVDYPRSNDGTHGGKFLATVGNSMRKIATDIPFVRELTKKFVKAHGKKGITRRSITSFLQEEGQGGRQYIASDIVRCLKHDHNIVIPDVLDIFPVKTASSNPPRLSSIYDGLVEAEIATIDTDIETSIVLGRCVSDIQEVMDLLNLQSTSS